MSQVVVSVMYNAPADPQAFEDYYAATHMPIAQNYFADAATMAAAMATPEAQAATGDIANFATGGAAVLIAQVV